MYNIESLINKFTKPYICFYNFFVARMSWNKRQVLEGDVVKKVKNHCYSALQVSGETCIWPKRESDLFDYLD